MNTPKSTKEKIKEMLISGQALTSCGAAKDFITADLRKYIRSQKRGYGYYRHPRNIHTRQIIQGIPPCPAGTGDDSRSSGTTSIFTGIYA